MKKRIAVEGLERYIVYIVCDILEKLSYEVCYRHESPYRKTHDYTIHLLEDPRNIVDDIIESQPDLTIVCNARGYLPFFHQYSETTDIPLLVLTGGGANLIDKVKKHTPYVLELPFSVQGLSDEIDEILGRAH